MKARIPLIAALAVAVLPVEASAQAWVSNPDFSEGVGIRAGDLELHPSLGGEFGYDSNFFRAAPSEGVVDVLRLRITPSLRLSTLGARRRNAPTPPSFTFNGGAYAAYNEIIPLSSSESDVSKQRNIAAGASAIVLTLDLLDGGMRRETMVRLARHDTRECAACHGAEGPRTTASSLRKPNFEGK